MLIKKIIAKDANGLKHIVRLQLRYYRGSAHVFIKCSVFRGPPFIYSQMCKLCTGAHIPKKFGGCPMFWDQLSLLFV
jgi:hypothetical protein